MNARGLRRVRCVAAAVPGTCKLFMKEKQSAALSSESARELAMLLQWNPEAPAHRYYALRDTLRRAA